MPSLMGGKSSGTPEGVCVTDPITSSDAFSDKESHIAEGRREVSFPRGNRPARSNLHVPPSRGRIPPLPTPRDFVYTLPFAISAGLARRIGG